jgi:hypothetical protein
MDHEDKELKTYIFKVKKYDSGMPEEFLRWSLVLNEQIKTMATAQIMIWS